MYVRVNRIFLLYDLRHWQTVSEPQQSWSVVDCVGQINLYPWASAECHWVPAQWNHNTQINFSEKMFVCFYCYYNRMIVFRWTEVGIGLGCWKTFWLSNEALLKSVKKQKDHYDLDETECFGLVFWRVGRWHLLSSLSSSGLDSRAVPVRSWFDYTW